MTLTEAIARYGPITGGVWAIAWKLFTVDARLERIEHHLGIENQIVTEVIRSANAKEK